LPFRSQTGALLHLPIEKLVPTDMDCSWRRVAAGSVWRIWSTSRVV